MCAVPAVLRNKWASDFFFFLTVWIGLRSRRGYFITGPKQCSSFQVKLLETHPHPFILHKHRGWRRKTRDTPFWGCWVGVGFLVVFWFWLVCSVFWLCWVFWFCCCWKEGEKECSSPPRCGAGLGSSKLSRGGDGAAAQLGCFPASLRICWQLPPAESYLLCSSSRAVACS